MEAVRHNFFFRVIGGGDHGSGHVHRCLILATHLRTLLPQSTFSFWLEGPYYALDWIRQHGFSIEHLGDPLDVPLHHSLVKNCKNAVYVIDKLDTQDDELNLYTRTGYPTILFSDVATKPANCSLVFQPQFLGPIGEQDSTQNLGPKYFIISPSFLNHNRESRVIPPVANRLLICLGGHTTDRGLKELVRLLPAIADQWKTVKWIIGRSSIEELPCEIPKIDNLEVEGFSQDLSAELKSADLALISGGFVKYEAAYCGVPACIVSLHSHQETLGLEFEKTGAARYIGPLANLDGPRLRNVLKELQHSDATRRSMSIQGRSLVDGRGLSRVSKKIIDLVLELSP